MLEDWIHNSTFTLLWNDQKMHDLYCTMRTMLLLDFLFLDRFFV